MNEQPLLFELGKPGRKAIDLPACDVPLADNLMPAKYLRTSKAALPEVSQLELMRHYTQLSNRNFGVDTGFYPLGSCTMKYNPKVNEDVARYPGLALLHPLQSEDTVQGAMEVLFKMEESLAEIADMAGVTLQPVAGAHGELTGLKLIRAYHLRRLSYRIQLMARTLLLRQCAAWMP